MGLFPPSTNAAYHGARSSTWFLALLGLNALGPGLIHYLLPDGGAGVIAGMNLANGFGKPIVAVFAWMGALQIPYGLLILAVALRYRALVPLLLALQIVQLALSAVAAWLTKGTLGGHHPPENYGVLVLLPLILVFFVLSLRRPAGGHP